MLQLETTEAAARKLLDQQLAHCPIPCTYALQEAFLDTVQIGALQLFMVGLVAASSAGGELVTGAAAGLGGYPVERAYFELLERTSIARVGAPDGVSVVRTVDGTEVGERSLASLFPLTQEGELLRPSRSNGVALHRDWPRACAAALSELVERDRILRSFAGEIAPRPSAEVDQTVARALSGLYELRAYAFDPPAAALRHCVSGVFLFPRSAQHPLVYGFGAGAGFAAARESATREALQRLAFLWGEALPEAEPAPSPTPDYHQEFYLYPPHHELLRAWLAGARFSAERSQRAPARPFEDFPVTFLDLTPRELTPAFRVAKAVSPHASPLQFGRGAGDWQQTLPHPVT